MIDRATGTFQSLKVLLEFTVSAAFLRNSKCFLLFLIHGTEFRVVFSSAEWFRTKFREFASIFIPRYRIPSIFLLCGMFRNRIPGVF